MGRSKFPGKPSKHVNRTRINVLPPLSNSITVGENKYAFILENEAEEPQEENNICNVEPSTSQSDNSATLKKKSSAKRNCKISVSNSKTKSILCRENLGIKRNKVTVNLSEFSLPKRTVRRSVQSFVGLRRISRSNSLKENSNIVGKFVLPSRSVHSSRVIKPNKRFINVDSVNRIEMKSIKKRVSNRKKCSKENEERKLKIKISNSDNQNANSLPCTNHRIVLRQARLKLNNSVPSGTDGPFSSHASTGSPPGTITCGVCGAVRFYRFIKQARKFNIYSCESCRKFISKIIKRQTCSKNSNVTTLVCHKGQGKCHVPPIVRSQQWNLIHCAYRARCPACWLKMCLRSFQMPQNLKNSLSKLLPVNMRKPDSNLFTNSPSFFSWQQQSSVINTRNSDSGILQTSVKQQSLQKQPKMEVNTNNILSSDIKRQKIDLKGPRVKHVCRSASIVLGQPIATFQSESDKNDCELSSINKDLVETDLSPQETGSISSNSQGLDDNFKEIKDNDSNQVVAIKSLPTRWEYSLNRKKEKGKNTNSELKIPQLNKKETVNNGISIDFWENYDPDEVCKNGFNLIASEPFPMQSICFLCGSAGREPLLYCSLCCEPYHSFCLEQDPQLLGGSIQYNWLCPRCTTCAVCGQPNKQKVNCQKCHKVYHPECFNFKWTTNDKPSVCLSCLRCKSCGTNNITKFVGNLPLCVMCFKLRKKGNFCPLCQKCYDDNDFNTKMMECAKCNKWVHAKCEGLSDENYQILSLLPESVEFICKLCSSNTTPYWRKAIETELRTSFNNVLRLLSKNRLARDMLKWSPLGNRIVSSKTASAARKLQFSDDECDEKGDFIGDDVSKSDNLIYNSETDEEIFTTKMSPLQEQHIDKTPHTPSMTNIKNKLNSSEIFSIREFNKKMDEALGAANSTKLIEIYQSILKTIFPWYDPDVFNQEDDKPAVTLEDTVTEVSKKPEVHINTWTNEKLNVKLTSDSEKLDSRICALCKGIGDGLSHQEARLLYCGQNEWIHANCALWSSEVYEEIDGSLQNVHSALSRGRSIRCSYCKLKGASVGCCAKGCYETYHFSCARALKCNFMHDKTVYCPFHDLPGDSTVISFLADFDIRRSVYVELDKKKKKLVDPSKVHTIVGSLSITNLGKIVPILSDTPEAIIPTGFVCSRLFWSTKEPWKLVPYVIKTSILNSQVNTIVVDKNFTVNHSQPKQVVDKKLKEIFLWQKELEKEKVDVVDLEDEDEPQNATEILSPELTDAILKELPRDLLDGISMQDIFPKFMSCEEFINVDFKNSDDSSKTEDTFKKLQDIEEKESTCDDILKSKRRELKRSKSEIFSQTGIEKMSQSRSQQRSCSLTWSCKLDTSLSPLVKKRKILPRDKNVFFHLLQVDGAYDSSSESECGSPRQESEDLWSTSICDKPVKCKRCQCTYRTQASFKRHLENCEIMSTSESESEMVDDGDFNSQDQSIQAVADAVASITESLNDSEAGLEVSTNSYEECTTYQVNEYNNHKTQLSFGTNNLPTDSSAGPLEILYPNVSPAEIEESSAQSGFTQNFSHITAISQPKTVSLTQPSKPTIFDPSLTFTTNTISQVTPIPLENQSSSICINQPNSVPFCLNQSTNSTGSISVVPNTPIALNQNSSLPGVISIGQHSIPLHTNPNSLHINQPIEIQSQQVTIQSIPINQEVNQVVNIAQPSPIAIENKVIPATTMVNTGIVSGQWIKTQPKLMQKVVKENCSTKLNSKKVVNSKILSGNTIVLPQTTSNPQVILQHLTTPSVMSPFLDTFQHQAGQNIQYVTTVGPQITPTVNPQPQIVQLQTENNLVGLLPSLQQPTMIIQQPRVVADQLIIDQNGSVMWASQSALQPIYYGFETIVQNTVMQSQQFLPTTVPGILTANSSYSSTTQVFQTSKLEPILDVSGSGFVVLNPNTVINNSQSLPVAQIAQVASKKTSETQQICTRPVVEIKKNLANSVEVNRQSSTTINSLKAAATVGSSTLTTTTNTHSSLNSNYNSITLPVVPFISEPRIPTNVVIPTPKAPISNQKRPMSRVLPMQTTVVRENKKAESLDKFQEVITKTEITEDLKKDSKKELLEEEVIKPKTKEIMIQTVETADKIPLITKTVVDKPKIQLPKNPTTENSQKNYSVQIISLKSVKPKPVSKCSSLPVIPSVETASSLKTSNSYSSPKKTEQDIVDTPLAKEKKETYSSQAENKSETKPEASSSPEILYTVETKDGFRYSSNSVSDLWSKVFEAVQGARVAHNMAPLPSNGLTLINNLQLLGLKANSLRYLLEQLPGASKCIKYKPSFKFKVDHGSFEDDLLIGQSYGAIRCAPYTRRNESNDMFGWLASKHRKLEEHTTSNEVQISTPLSRRSSVTNLPMAMRFRQLRLSSKVSVGVYRSSIHRRGLFCLRDIESGEMVIEYAGEVIRSVLTDKREKLYNSKGIGCYMFRIDDNLVVDATMKGNAARFINHSCDPNCYSKVVEILSHKHIIIFALRKIHSGEELTYDYKFPFEEDKIPCTCGARRCRKFLN